MFKFIKSIFTSEKTATCELSIQNISRGVVTAKYAGNELSMSGDIEPITIQLKDMKDLSLKEDGAPRAEDMPSETGSTPVGNAAGASLCFTSHDKKYSLKSPDVSALYNVLHPLVHTSYLFEAFGLSYLVYNSAARSFELYDKPVTLRLYEDVLYYLRIEDPGAIIHFEKISTDTQYYVDEANLSFVWSTYSDCKFYTFCLRFKGPAVFAEFRKLYVELCYKSTNAKEEYNSQRTVYGSMGSYVNKDDDEEDLLGDGGQPGAISLNTGSPFMGSKGSPKGGAASQAADVSNKLLVMGSGQCFITRGTSLGVFDLDKDDVKFRTHIKDAVDDPVKIITHNGDSSLLVLDKNDNKQLGLMDLSRGEIIEKWDMGTAVNDYFDSNKNSNDNTLVGLSDYSLFRIDPRAAERVVAKKVYKCRNEFSCGAATDRGDIAVASRRGDLRLYDKIEKRAKTLLPGFGDAVLGVDTSRDGGLVLCTYKSYLLLFQVNSNYSKNSKDAAPIRLQLKPQHLAVLADEISFSPAKFDLEDSVIITSTGRYIMEWKVADVLEGGVYSYTIKSLGEHVVDEDFIIDGKDVVVATKNNVRKIPEGELKRK